MFSSATSFAVTLNHSVTSFVISLIVSFSVALLCCNSLLLASISQPGRSPSLTLINNTKSYSPSFLLPNEVVELMGACKIQVPLQQGFSSYTSPVLCLAEVCRSPRSSIFSQYFQVLYL
jgi:hypothetical protein